MKRKLHLLLLLFVGFSAKVFANNPPPPPNNPGDPVGCQDENGIPLPPGECVPVEGELFLLGFVLVFVLGFYYFKVASKHKNA